MRIYLAFKNTKSHDLPRAKFKEMLTGPLLPQDESPSENNIHGRNVLFELEMAALFKRAGLKISKYDDVQFNFKKKQFNVQCKRIHSHTGVAANVDSAVCQITKRMKDSNTKGLICLSIDKISDKEGYVLEAESHESVVLSLNQICGDFISLNREFWQSLVNINVLGALIFFGAIALLKNHKNGPLLISCRQTTMDIIPKNIFPQQSDYKLIKALSSRLMNLKAIGHY